MKASSFFILCVLFVALEHPAPAQQPPANAPRVGYVATTAPDTPNNLAFRKGLRDLGYIEGKNILDEYRYTEGKRDRVPSLVAELVRRAAAVSGWFLIPVSYTHLTLPTICSV